ncbi:MAG: aspartate kinase, partial [Muribaculaceae bacterium]|nr:aspartate kinase [Muribaculaceae bacterium]
MKVLKFGGTSVGTVGSLANVKSIVDSLEEPAVVVVSALGGLTDRLIATARSASEGDLSFREGVAEMSRRHFDIIEELVPQSRRDAVRTIVSDLLSELEDIYTGVALIRELSEKTLSRIVSFGERMSSVIVAEILDNAEHRDSLTFMRTEKWFNRDIAARQLTDDLIREAFPLPLARTVVTGGFISLDKDTGEITNLGRGGSDYTAALIAAALDADSLEIWTDVDGFMTADPRVIHDATVIDSMSFIESMELCSFGAKVIYPPTIYPVFHKNIPIKILNTFNPSAPGTLITDGSENLPSDVRGVSSVKNTCMVSVSGSLTSNVAQINSRSYNA